MSDLPNQEGEQLRGVVVQYDPIRRVGAVRLPAPHGRLTFFLSCVVGSLKEQVLAASSELNRLRKRAGTEARLREVVDQVKSLLVKREVLLEVRRTTEGRLRVRRMYEIPAAGGAAAVAEPGPTTRG